MAWPLACAPPAAPCPKAPASPPTVALIKPAANAAATMADALVRRGHVCAPSAADGGVQICDRDLPGKATLVVVYAEPMAHLASHYRRKPDKACADVVPTINQLNLAVDGVKLVCVDDRVTFVTSFLVPDNGLSERSFVAHAERFQGQIKLLLREGDLLPMLE